MLARPSAVTKQSASAGLEAGTVPERTRFDSDIQLERMRLGQAAVDAEILPSTDPTEKGSLSSKPEQSTEVQRQKAALHADGLELEEKLFGSSGAVIVKAEKAMTIRELAGHVFNLSPDLITDSQIRQILGANPALREAYVKDGPNGVIPAATAIDISSTSRGHRMAADLMNERLVELNMLLDEKAGSSVQLTKEAREVALKGKGQLETEVERHEKSIILIDAYTKIDQMRQDLSLKIARGEISDLTALQRALKPIQDLTDSSGGIAKQFLSDVQEANSHSYTSPLSTMRSDFVRSLVKMRFCGNNTCADLLQAFAIKKMGGGSTDGSETTAALDQAKAAILQAQRLVDRTVISSVGSSPGSTLTPEEQLGPTYHQVYDRHIQLGQLEAAVRTKQLTVEIAESEKKGVPLEQSYVDARVREISDAYGFAKNAASMLVLADKPRADHYRAMRDSLTSQQALSEIELNTCASRSRSADFRICPRAPFHELASIGANDTDSAVISSIFNDVFSPKTVVTVDSDLTKRDAPGATLSAPYDFYKFLSGTQLRRLSDEQVASIVTNIAKLPADSQRQVLFSLEKYSETANALGQKDECQVVAQIYEALAAQKATSQSTIVVDEATLRCKAHIMRADLLEKLGGLESALEYYKKAEEGLSSFTDVQMRNQLAKQLLFAKAGVLVGLAGEHPERADELQRLRTEAEKGVPLISREEAARLIVMEASAYLASRQAVKCQSVLGELGRYSDVEFTKGVVEKFKKDSTDDGLWAAIKVAVAESGTGGIAETVGFSFGGLLLGAGAGAVCGGPGGAVVGASLGAIGGTLAQRVVSTVRGMGRIYEAGVTGLNSETLSSFGLNSLGLALDIVPGSAAMRTTYKALGKEGASFLLGTMTRAESKDFAKNILATELRLTTEQIAHLSEDNLIKEARKQLVGKLGGQLGDIGGRYGTFEAVGGAVSLVTPIAQGYAQIESDATLTPAQREQRKEEFYASLTDNFLIMGLLYGVSKASNRIVVDSASRIEQLRERYNSEVKRVHQPYSIDLDLALPIAPGVSRVLRTESGPPSQVTVGEVSLLVRQEQRRIDPKDQSSKLVNICYVSEKDWATVQKHLRSNDPSAHGLFDKSSGAIFVRVPEIDGFHPETKQRGLWLTPTQMSQVEATIVHELAHANGQGEFGAYRASYDYLTSQHEYPRVSDEQILKFLTKQYGEGHISFKELEESLDEFNLKNKNTDSHLTAVIELKHDLESLKGAQTQKVRELCEQFTLDRKKALDGVRQELVRYYREMSGPSSDKNQAENFARDVLDDLARKMKNNQNVSLEDIQLNDIARIYRQRMPRGMAFPPDFEIAMRERLSGYPGQEMTPAEFVARLRTAGPVDPTFRENVESVVKEWQKNGDSTAFRARILSLVDEDFDTALKNVDAYYDSRLDTAGQLDISKIPQRQKQSVTGALDLADPEVRKQEAIKSGVGKDKRDVQAIRINKLKDKPEFVKEIYDNAPIPIDDLLKQNPNYELTQLPAGIMKKGYFHMGWELRDRVTGETITVRFHTKESDEGTGLPVYRVTRITPNKERFELILDPKGFPLLNNPKFCKAIGVTTDGEGRMWIEASPEREEKAKGVWFEFPSDFSRDVPRSLSKEEYNDFMNELRSMENMTLPSYLRHKLLGPLHIDYIPRGMDINKG